MEYFDVYSNERQKVGKKLPRGSELSNNECRLAVHVIIFNGKGEMLIQQRQETKKKWPNLWDVSVGGNVMTGETTQLAGERETKEELGIQISLQGLRPFFTINFDNGFDDFYFIETNFTTEELMLQKEEVKQVKWASKQEVMKLYNEGKFIPYYKSFLESMFEVREKRGIHKK